MASRRILVIAVAMMVVLAGSIALPNADIIDDGRNPDDMPDYAPGGSYDPR